MSRHAGTGPASANSGSPSISASFLPLEIVLPAATSSLDMYTAPGEPPPAAAGPGAGSARIRLRGGWVPVVLRRRLPPAAHLARGGRDRGDTLRRGPRRGRRRGIGRDLLRRLHE